MKARWDKQLSRRLFLGGAGTLLALPAFESLGVSRALGQSAAPPKRFLAYYVPCGIQMNGWTPASTGAGYAMTPILTPLAALQDKFLVLSGLDNEPARPEAAGDHASGTAGFLTARHVTKTEGADIKNGISLDQQVAGVLAEGTRIASLQLGIDGGGNSGGCDSGYSCAYSHNVSWASDTQPLPKTINPRVLFDQLFQGFDAMASAAELARRLKYRKSVLDFVLEDATSLAPRLGTTDRRKLDEFMSAVRDVEMRIDTPDAGPMCVPIDQPPDRLSYPEHVRVMADLMVLAMQCDSTRVISFMLGNAGSNRSYADVLPGLNVTGGHHEISHHGGDAENLRKLREIAIWEAGEFAYLLSKMDAVLESDGESLLHHSAVFFSSEIEDGDSHSHYNMPIILAGAAGGSWTPGRHLQIDDKVSNLFVTIQNALGVPDTTFGDDGTGPLDLG
jgi:hypothetical protein